MIKGVAEVTVGFSEVDIMEVAWHGNYVAWLEAARCAALQSIGYDYPEMRESGYAWPVIDMRIRYAGMARYGQKLRVEAVLVEWENRLRFQYVVRDAKSGKRITKAETTQVAIDWKSGEMLFRSPDVLFHKLGIPVP